MKFFSNLFQRYTNSLRTAPYSTKMLTSCLVFGTSDVICQIGIEKKTMQDYSPLRTFRQAMIGTFFVAPTLHLWHSYAIPFATRSLRSKVKIMATSYLLGEGVLSPYFLSTTLFFYEYLGTWDLNETIEGVKEKFIPTLIKSFQFWGVVSLFTYSIVPPIFRPVFSNCFSLIWQIYLSYIANLKHEHHELETLEPYPLNLAELSVSDAQIVSQSALLKNLMGPQ